MPVMDADPRFARLRELGGDRYAAFLAAGYREYYSGVGMATPFLLQKGVDGGGGGRLFYVNCWVYHHADMDPQISYAPEAHFNYGGSGGVTPFTVRLSRCEMAAAEVEAFFLRAFTTLGCSPHGD